MNDLSSRVKSHRSSVGPKIRRTHKGKLIESAMTIAGSLGSCGSAEKKVESEIDPDEEYRMNKQRAFAHRVFRDKHESQVELLKRQ